MPHGPVAYSTERSSGEVHESSQWRAFLAAVSEADLPDGRSGIGLQSPVNPPAARFRSRTGSIESPPIPGSHQSWRRPAPARRTAQLARRRPWSWQIRHRYVRLGTRRYAYTQREPWSVWTRERRSAALLSHFQAVTVEAPAATCAYQEILAVSIRCWQNQPDVSYPHMSTQRE
jgi:hypothetical protein